MSEATVRVLLLRGVNVGGSRTVPMAELRTALEAAGHRHVRTLLQSGNAVLATEPGPSDAVAAAVAVTLRETFGFPTDLLVLDLAALREVVARCPFPARELDPTQLHVVFLDRPARDHPLAEADPGRFAPDELRLGERELYVRYPHGSGRSRLARALSAPLPGGIATARNWRTVTRLLELAESTPAA
ncbi:DUF1697 domain-containing protein [Streptomyces bohaiensis]|uniref:DUF1697 domain-containing protein n=1 Tax=Streptomyces bohaiensis TaxID=1431344 RepID=A0ABX1C8I0_9ACTN|nr:DUF1697 domain-containing protein [Streptomyces bohaiensis]NJQ15383.1 DUF1697 domain-containing protein [Streptomyces bohaiensis]